MKKILLAFALLLLAGCIWPWGGSKDELELVPKSANSVIIIRLSAALNDSDISPYYSQVDLTSELKRVEATTGIDETKIDRVVLFMNFDSTQPSGNSYGGFIIRGTMDKGKILENMNLNNIITNTSYGNQPMYGISSKQAPQNKSYFYFFDSTTLIGGTKEAVQDSIDASNGKIENVKARQKLSQTYDALDKKSLLIFLLDISPNMKNEVNNIAENQSTARAFSHVDCVGLSLSKDGKDVSIKLLVNTEDAVSANDVSIALEDQLYPLKGIAQSGSALESITKKVNIAAKGNVVTVTLPTTVEELKNLQEQTYVSLP
jgi:hypothetical protein